MSSSFEDRIIKSRRLFQNPYAYIDGDGGYSATATDLDGRIRQSRTLLEDPYAHLDGDSGYSAVPSTPAPKGIRVNINDIRSSGIVGKRVSFEKIEEVARSLQVAIWINRKELLKGKVPDDPVAVLDPAVAFSAIGYDFEVSDTLGQLMTSQGMVDCAGFIDRSALYAGVSSQFPLPVRNFTAAHELGHALLHDAQGMHRDRALDGGSVSGLRDRIEVEADKFASFFLMPERLVRAEFLKRFSTEQFLVSDDTAFALINNSQEALRSECKDVRKLARKLATTDHYAGRFFESMSARFGVSTAAMAIRLEELKLLEF